MLSSVQLNDVASFDKDGTEILGDLKQINFIYGSNGSGKTTISNFLSGIEPDKYQNCQAIWAHVTPVKTLVYNKQFREDNFGDGKIAGVFTLGKATKDEIEVIEKKKSDLSNLRDDIKRLKETLQKQNEQLQIDKDNYDKDRWDNIYLKYKDEFKEAFRGSIGSKKDFTKKLKQYCDSGYSTEVVLTIEEIREKAKTIFGKKPTRIEPLSCPEYDNIVKNETDPIWQTVIVGKSDVDIAGLINQLGANDWVDKGRKYISENKICPFCQQETITNDFREQLESFFDDSFKTKKASVSTTKKEYEDSFTTQLSSLKTLLSQEKQSDETKLDCNLLETLFKTLESQFSENKEHLKNKLEHVSNMYELSSTKATWNEIKQCIEKANENVSKHNQIVSEFVSETHNLKENIWLYVAAESQVSHKAYVKKVNGLQTGIGSITQNILKKEKQAKEINSEIIELNKNVTSVQPTVDEINRLLSAFGFHNFSLVPSPDTKNHYTVKYEDGSLAHKSLSEGEVTFITLLYFLQLVKGSHSESGVSDDRIVVIDDPISSLDSNILFIVSTLIKGLIKEIKENTGRTKQLIILTHNVYFHKEASFIDGRTTRNNQTNYWIIRKINKLSRIQAYGMDNPVESSYELLWREVQNWRNNSGTTVQNTMRRIIENYFKILGKFGDDDLINKFDTQEERDICRSLLCWINDGSHCLPDDLFIQTPEDETQRFVDVFKGIFEHTDNIGHYNMMMRNSVEVEAQ
ncbi:MAG: AAA family ATPase [Candidatus Delongbacteria bacterium]